jgi:hypothetical protein
MGQDGRLDLGRDAVPERCRDRWSSSHTLYYETSVQEVRSGDGSGRPKTLSSMRRTAYQLLPVPRPDTLDQVRAIGRVAFHQIPPFLITSANRP